MWWNCACRNRLWLVGGRYGKLPKVTQMLEFTNNLPSVSHWPVRPVELDFRLHDGTPVVHIWYGAAKRKAQLRDHGDYTYVVTAGNKKTEYLIGINYASLVETLTECSAKTEGICVSMDGYSCRVTYRDFDNKLVYKMDACCCVRLDRV